MRNVRDNFLLFILGLSLATSTFAQEISVKGGFVQDSVKIGEDIQYWLTASYPQALDLVLPDTLYDFTPWEFSGKRYFPSTLKGDQVFDSAVYVLQSFEIDPVQYLSLPAFLIKSENDTVTINAATDSLFFQSLIPVQADSIQLKTNTVYQEVSALVNYPLIWIVAGALLVITIVVFFIFGKRIRRMLKLRKLKKEYIKFSEELTRQIRTLKKEPAQNTAEQALVKWKLFLEKMENRPFSKLTTKEIMALDYTNELNDTLKNIDRCIYGGISDENLYKSFQAIEDFTQHRYTVITDQIKNS